MNAMQKLMALLLIGLTMVSPAMAAYTANYTISDVDDIFIDVIATGVVEVKDEIPTLVDLGILWVILAMLVSIVALAVALIMMAPQRIGKAMGRRKA